MSTHPPGPNSDVLRSGEMGSSASEQASTDAARRVAGSELVQRYLDQGRVQRRLAPRTLALYTEHLGLLLKRAAQAQVQLTQVQPSHVRRWMAQLHAAGRQPRGIALILSCWRSFYRWLGQERLIQANPVQDVQAPKAAQPLPKALSVDDAMRLADFEATAADPWTEARDRAIVELLYGCGLRVSELTGLDLFATKDSLGWLDLDSAELQVLGKGNKRRSVPIGQKALQALRAWLPVRDARARQGWSGRSTDSTPLFVGARGARMNSQAVWKMLRARSVQAGLPAPVHPHMLRHSFASHVLQSSSDLRAVQELLGHANISTTQVYTRLDFQHLARAYDAAHPRAQLRSAPGDSRPASAAGLAANKAADSATESAAGSANVEPTPRGAPDDRVA